MIKLIFNQFGFYTGVDRERLNGEDEMYISELPLSISKTVTKSDKRPKTDSSGRSLYSLTSLGVHVDEISRVETTKKTDYPVYYVVHEKRPVINSEGIHVYTVRTKLIQGTEVTDTPFELNGVHQKNPAGEYLYNKYVELGPRVYRYTDEVTHKQKENHRNEPLYWIEQEVTKYYPSKIKTEEILSTDPRWTSSLDKVYTSEPYKVSYSFKENPFIFTYDEIREYKKNMLLRDTFALEAFLIEDYDVKYFDSMLLVDTMKNFVRVNPGGHLLTKPAVFKNYSNYFKLFPEVSSSGLEFTGYITYDDGTVQEVKFNNENEVIIGSYSKSIHFKVYNPTGKPIVIDSLGIIS